MWTDALLAYFHFFSLIGTVSLLVAEAFLCRPGIRGEALHRLKQMDIAYAGFAGLALASGLLRVFWGAKGSAFYLGNPVFHAKVGLFLLIGLVSIVPTLKFIAWSRAARQDAGRAPAEAAVLGARRIVFIELAGIVALPLLAALMARGLGLG
jgi:putative membrane protein